MRYLRFALLGLLALAALLLPPSPKGASGLTGGYPDSMLSLGDSITRAANPDPSLPLGDNPEYSWSTGGNSTVQSHYYRILQHNSAIAGKNFNYAVSGAKMASLSGQVQLALDEQTVEFEYVTILMGGNDVCTSSEATMTTVANFRSWFQSAMEKLTTELPDARIFVASVPNIYHMWDILKDNETAQGWWDSLQICQSMLLRPLSEDPADVARRENVRQRNIDFNTQLAEVCALYPNCLFDNNVGFNSDFGTSDVSTVDYFHPSIQGQTGTAALSWNVTFFADPDGDGLLNVDDNCQNTVNPGQENNVHPATPAGDACEDPDADTVMDAGDNCPDWYNPGQGSPPWLVPAGDNDCDGFTDARENAIGTSPNVACDDGKGLPDWPSDFDNSKKTDIFDVLDLKPHFNKQYPDPDYSQRHDLDANSKVDIFDVLELKPLFNMTCT